MQGQRTVINGLIEEGSNVLKNLWAGHLMERGVYDKVAFILTSEKAYPNLHREMMRRHMDNELRECMSQVIKLKTSIQQNRLLRKGVYAVSSLLGGSSNKTGEMYNGFKDEFTVFTQYKGHGLGF
ncbi:hypothetical protein ACEZ3G_08820 [Maribacter algicola]|uniref:Uncharacterized protein n=1 Tax=Meishania litoralis TaxID=3434685 RepID=A0ACC7LJ44_9FLAO